mgnify:CR=1 FL=1
MTISWSDYKIESSTSLTQSSLSSFGGKLYSALPLLQLDVTEEVLSVKVLAVLGAALACPDDEGPPPPALAVPGVVVGQVVHVVCRRRGESPGSWPGRIIPSHIPFQYGRQFHP